MGGKRIFLAVFILLAEYVIVSRSIEEYKVQLALLAIGDLLEIFLVDHHDGDLRLQLLGHCEQLDALTLSSKVEHLFKRAAYVSLDVC